MSGAPDNWPDKQYLTLAREAIRDWLMVESAGADVGDFAVDPGGELITIAGLNVNSHTAAGRVLTISGCNQSDNDGRYRVVEATASNTIRITPALPTPTGITEIEWSLQSAVARYFKTVVFFEHNKRIPDGDITANDCPFLMVSAEGTYQSGANRSQWDDLEPSYMVVGAGAGRDPSDAEYGLCLVRSRLFRGREPQERFRMPAGAKYQRVMIGAPTMKLRDGAAEGESTATGLFWSWGFELQLGVGQSPDLQA